MTSAARSGILKDAAGAAGPKTAATGFKDAPKLAICLLN